MRVTWTAGRSNKSILKEISPEYSLEGLMLKLKLQYFGHLLEELTHLALMLGKRRLYSKEIKPVSSKGINPDSTLEGLMVKL